jgi:AraC family transcriptional regulator of adaptative response/methylated-DNA-[protein]-cysteine methyltransferase
MMNLAINDHRLTKPGPQDAALRDYDSVRRAIAFISEHWRAQPTIEAMADAAADWPGLPSPIPAASKRRSPT